MMFTPKLVPSTSLTVSETPSSATEPFGAMKRAKAGRRSSTNLTLSPSGVRSRIMAGRSIDMTGDDMAAELIAESQRALEIDAACPLSKRTAWCAPAVSLETSTANDGALLAPSLTSITREAAAVAGDRGALKAMLVGS